MMVERREGHFNNLLSLSFGGEAYDEKVEEGLYFKFRYLPRNNTCVPQIYLYIIICNFQSRTAQENNSNYKSC